MKRWGSSPRRQRRPASGAVASSRMLFSRMLDLLFAEVGVGH